MDAQSYFSVKLVDLGVSDPRFSGVWIPESEVGVSAVGLSAQFTDNAADYASKYASTSYFKSLFVRGLAMSGAKLGATPKILDIGAGAGDNSVIPSLDLFEEPEIIATDLSPNLLGILRSEVVRRNLSDTIAVVCADAMRDFFVPERFDLVTGSAILHHLIDPSRAIAAAFRALKPGGIAMFFEPFEFGHSILLLMFERMISENSLRDDKLNPTALHLLVLFAGDLRRRLGRDKSSAVFHDIDDKWLFSTSYFREVGEAEGFREVRVESIHAHKHQVLNRTRDLLALGGNIQLPALPNWAHDIVRQYDTAFVETSPEIISEGIVTMRKPSGRGYDE
jgi:ubiquinone/menaquinone biosynthesis C-methylase UbiE